MQSDWGCALRYSVPGLLIALAVLMPFLDNAFIIDDPFYLRQAEHAMKDPLHPSSFPIIWDAKPEVTDRAVPLSQEALVGPGIAYIMLPAAFAGMTERSVHLTQLVLFGIAIIVTVRLALRICETPAQVTLSGILLASTPTALAMASTGMPDIPAMTFGVLAMDSFWAWRERPSVWAFIGSAFWLACATITRSHLLLIALVACILLYKKPERIDISRWLLRFLPVLTGLALAAFVLHLTRDTSPQSGQITAVVSRYSDIANVLKNARAFLAHWVLALPLVAGWLLLRPRQVHWRYLFLIVLASLAWAEWREDRFVWIWAVGVLSAWVLAEIALTAVRSRDTRQLALAAWLFVALPVSVYHHLPAKYLLASAPGMAILVACNFRYSRFQALSVASLTLGAVLLGVLIIRASGALGESGRWAAMNEIAPRVALGQTVWSVGHWGYQWYAEDAGAHTLAHNLPQPKTGDVIVHDAASGCRMLESYPNRRLISMRSFHDPGGRVMSFDLGVGFYSNGWGLKPWAWGTNELDRVEVWQLE